MGQVQIHKHHIFSSMSPKNGKNRLPVKKRNACMGTKK
jgi:hypothetical protein